MTAVYPAPGTFPCVTMSQAQIARLKAAHAEVERLEAEIVEARKKRAAVIRKLDADGAGLREIARELDVTHPAVRKIIDRGQ